MTRHLHVDAEAGIRRRRRGRGFSYIGPDGAPLPDAERERVEALVVPPAWQDVWINPDPEGHIQATGRDARGRKQYIYHERWHRRRAGIKFDRLESFAEALPALRDAVQADLRRPGLPRAKVVAAVVRVLDRAFIRVGSDRYARENGSYGASTLENRHVRFVSRQRVCFRFDAKGGKEHEVDMEDPRLASVVRRCQELPGQRLFEYEDEDGRVVEVDSDDVNTYLHEVMDGPFTSKDFRTWAASTLLLHRLLEAGPGESEQERQVCLREAVKEVAGQLNNTPAVCKRSYLHPVVGIAYLDGTLEKRVADAPPVQGLWPEESRMAWLLATFR